MEILAVTTALNLISRLIPAKEPQAATTAAQGATAGNGVQATSFTKVLDSVTAIKPGASVMEVTAANSLSALHQLPEVVSYLENNGFAGIQWQLNANGELTALDADGNAQPVPLSAESQAAVRGIYQQAAQTLPPQSAAPLAFPYASGTAQTMTGTPAILQLSAFTETGNPAASWQSSKPHLQQPHRPLNALSQFSAIKL